MTQDAPTLKKVVLVVEDEPLLLIHAVDLVEEAGMEAVIATDADKAIEILISRTDITIVFTDIDMPGSMNGLKLAAAVRDRWPPIEIIVVCDKYKPEIHEIPARGVFFRKPFVGSKIVDELRRMAA